jgi:hypothetical protein
VPMYVLEGPRHCSKKLDVNIQWKSCMVQVHLFPFKTSLETKISKLKHTQLVSKGQVVAHLPLNMCITCKWTCEVRGVLVQLEHHK